MYFRYGDESWEPSDANEAERSGRASDSDGAADDDGHALPRQGGNGPSNGNGHASGNGSAHRGNGRVRPHRLPTVDLRGVRVHAVSEGDAIRHIMTELGEGRGGMVVTPNLEHLHRCLHDVAFAAMVSEAEL